MNVHDCNNGISSNHLNELPEQLPIHCKHNRSRTQTNVRHFNKINWCLIKMRSQDWRQLVARIIRGNLSMIGDEKIINLQRTKVYVSSDSLVCLGQIHENLNRTMHAKTDWDGSNLQNTEILTESTASKWNSSGIFSQGQYIAAQ